MLLPGLSKAVSRRVNRLSIRGDQDAAMKLASTYARWRPSDPRAWTLLGETLVARREYLAAGRALQDGVGRHPDSPEIGYLLATVMIEQSRLDEAAELLERQTERFPASFFPYLGLVRHAKARGEQDRVFLQARETEKRIPPTYPWAAYELATQLILFPSEREAVLTLLKSAADGLPRDESRYALSHLLLAVLTENRNPQQAGTHARLARQYWRSPADFDEFAEQTRRALV